MRRRPASPGSITITANTIARPRTAVSLVLDRSGSMNDDAGDGMTKVAKLREAAHVFLDVMLPDDGIGLVRFNEAAQRIMEIEDVGAAPGGADARTPATHRQQRTRSQGRPRSATVSSTAATMLDDAQAAARPPMTSQAMVVLTDGMWNTPPSLAECPGSITATTYAVGLGLPSNISVPAADDPLPGAQRLPADHRCVHPDQSTRLTKYFLQILAGVTNAQIVADPAACSTPLRSTASRSGSAKRISEWMQSFSVRIRSQSTSTSRRRTVR